MSGSNFFDFREQLTRKKSEVPTPPASAAPAEPLSVTQLTSVIDRAIRTGIPSSVLVKGEVSNFKHHGGSGHFYFTLKDAKSCIDCVMWRSHAARLKFAPEDGQELVARGEVRVYPDRGRYQLYVTSLQPVGRGALEIAFRQLHAKLAAAGLFSTERKRPIPPYPARIAIVTSRQTAALQDVLKVLRPFHWLKLFVYHVPVQGEGAAALIAAAIQHIATSAGSIRTDLILLARGGGSLEDLWEFNVETVARAIIASTVPVVTGIGHEVDTSIADLVADYHAHTPTEAAQVIVAQWRTAPAELATGANRLRAALRRLVGDGRHRLNAIHRHEFFRRPTDRIYVLRQMLDDRQRALVVVLVRRIRRDAMIAERLASKLVQCHPQHTVQLARQRVATMSRRLMMLTRAAHEKRVLRIEAVERQLEALSPRNVLRRGYSITLLKKGGAIVRSPEQVKPGDRLLTRFADGEIQSTVEDAKQPRLFED